MPQLNASDFVHKREWFEMGEEEKIIICRRFDVQKCGKRFHNVRFLMLYCKIKMVNCELVFLEHSVSVVLVKRKTRGLNLLFQGC